MAKELAVGGCDSAVAAEVWGGKTAMLDGEGIRIAADTQIGEAVEQLIKHNGRLGGLPDVVALRGSTIVVRELKRRRRDRIGPKQHEFLRRLRLELGNYCHPEIVDQYRYKMVLIFGADIGRWITTDAGLIRQTDVFGCVLQVLSFDAWWQPGSGTAGDGR